MTETPSNDIPGELDARVDEIYAADLNAFIDARKALVADLKSSGDKQSAAKIQKLAKPNLLAWAINQLFFREREVYDRLVEAGEALRSAQQDGDAEDLRAASEQRREALLEAVDKGAALLAQGGHAAPLQTLQRLERSLETVAAYGHSGLLKPPVGRLIGDLEAPGFEVLASLAMAPPKSSDGGRVKGGHKAAKSGGKSDRIGSGKRVKAAGPDKKKAPPPPKLSVLRGGGEAASTRLSNEAGTSVRTADAGQLRERNRLLRKARQLETLVSKSETASVRSQRSLAETERAFDLRRRNLEAAKKAYDESKSELDKRQARLTELQEQRQELEESLAEVRAKLAELDGGER